MSGDTEVPNLKPEEIENAIESDGNKGEKIKRNYCYVCKIQCTAEKNYLEHKEGKKHLKKISQLEEAGKKLKKNLKKNKNSVKKLNNSFKTPEENTNELESSEIASSSSKAMNNTKRKSAQNYKNFQHHHLDYQSYNNPNSSCSYPNNYHNGNQEYFYNQNPYAYSKWQAPHHRNVPQLYENRFNNYDFRQPNQHYAYPRYNAGPFKNEYFPADKNMDFGHQGYQGDGSNLPFTSVNSENSVYDFLSNEITETQEKLAPSLKSFRNANKFVSKKSRSQDTANLAQNTASVTDLNQSGTGCVTDLNSSISTVENDVHSTPTVAPNVQKSKGAEKERLRTRSSGSSDSINSKKLKDKNEAVDSDGTSEEQKLKEYTTTLLETNPNRLSLMIQHPSNFKEKAVLNHIMTSFAKTKRKENLTKKLRSNSLGSVGNNEDIALEAPLSVITPGEISGQITTDSNQNKCSPSVRKSRNSSKESNSNSVLNIESRNASSPTLVSDNKSSKKSRKLSNKSKESSSKSKASVSLKEKSSESIPADKPVKRKSLDSDANIRNKKQKHYDMGVSESPSCSRVSDETRKGMTSAESTLNHSSSTQTPDSFLEVGPFKEEITDFINIAHSIDMNQASSPTVETPTVPQNQTPDFSSPFSVETLIELFASGRVAVKREFNDPVIEAIKAVDPNELINACSNNAPVNNTAEKTRIPLDSNPRASKSTTSEVNRTNQENTNCTNPIILGSTVDSDNITPVSMVQRKDSHSSNPVSTEKSKDPSSSSAPDAAEKDILSEVDTLNLISRTKSEFPHLTELIEKLLEIASEEEKVKENITQAKAMITEYSGLLEEWKNKKRRFHNEEEGLRKKRNDIIQLMQNAVKQPRDTDTISSEPKLTEPQSNSSSEAPLISGNSKIEQKVGKVQNDKSTEESSSSSSSSSESSSPDRRPKKKKPNSSDSDEILILPSPVKPKPQEIIIIDDTDESTTRNTASTVYYQGSGLFGMKNMDVHSTIVNCIVVFDDYIYTCSNDNTAKRFSLKDPKQTVTYLHSTKNVTEVVVEKVQSESLVFTSSSNKVLSLFIASNGTKIKTFFQAASIMSICKGWGKFYAGLGDGTVNVYNWKYEEKEVVKSSYAACRIATADQGRLHILIILTNDGSVALRDAETSLLIRCIKANVRIPSWLTVYNDLAYLSSSDQSLFVIDILSGKIEKKIHLSSHATGLAVYDDHIFNISYSGIISCINKNKISDRKYFYGAGKNGLTCIHVFQDWVFTGNRKGSISFFQFDPFARATCKFSKCSSVYGSREDLLFHLEKDHMFKKNLSKCYWGNCTYVFPNTFSLRDKVNHTKKHISSSC